MYFMIATDWLSNFPSGVTMNGIWPNGGLPAETKSKITQRNHILNTTKMWVIMLLPYSKGVGDISPSSLIIIVIVIIIIILSYLISRKKKFKTGNTITAKHFDRNMQPLKLSIIVEATSIWYFTITAEILARLLANCYGQYADRHMNLKLMPRVSERERAIRQFVIVKTKLISVSNASVLILTMNFVISLLK